MDEGQEEKPGYAVAMPNRNLISILVLGGLTGLIVWGLGLTLNRYVFDVLFCQNAVSSNCVNALTFAELTALIIASIMAVFGLIRLKVYRPLLIVLAAAISLWGLAQLTWGTTWYIGALIAFSIYLLAYGLFAWVARIRQFWIALIVTILAVLAVRLAFSL